VAARITKWAAEKEELWEAVLARSQKAARVASPTPNLEKSVIAALRLGDVRKALQLFVSAPIAPKCDETFTALKALHAQAMRSVQPPSEPIHDAPIFTDDRVREALSTFAPTSAAGLFGYRPSLLQQCARAESYHFVSTLGGLLICLLAEKHLCFYNPF